MPTSLLAKPPIAADKSSLNSPRFPLFFKSLTKLPVADLKASILLPKAFGSIALRDLSKAVDAASPWLFSAFA